MATAKHTDYSSAQSLLSTELNSIANNANSAAGSAYDNATNKYLLMDLELNLAAQGSARAAGATIEVYLNPQPDGTNYAAVHEQVAELVAVFPLDAATTARRVVRRDIPVPPSNIKLFARNRTGQTFAASGNVITAFFHNIDIS